MAAFEKFVFDHFGYFFAFVVVWNVGAFSVLFWRRKKYGIRFPARDDVRIQFEESWASGVSFKSLFTRLVSASNCLRVTVTDDELWITPIFPFSAFGRLLDLDHRVPRTSITALEPRWWRGVRIRYQHQDGDERIVELTLRRRTEFLAVFGQCDA